MDEGYLSLPILGIPKTFDVKKKKMSFEGTAFLVSESSDSEWEMSDDEDGMCQQNVFDDIFNDFIVHILVFTALWPTWEKLLFSL